MQRISKFVVDWKEQVSYQKFEYVEKPLAPEENHELATRKF